LKYLSLGDVIQLLGANASTGILRLESQYAPEPALVYFKDGNPIDAVNGPKKGLEALYSLFGWTEGEFEFNQEAVSNEKVITKGRMGIILEGLKLKDDGQIEILGPASLQNSIAMQTGSDTKLPLIKGPLVDYMYVVDEEDFQDGQNIVEEGRHGNWIWVILEGVVEIAKRTPAGLVPILRIGDGSFIGSLSTFLIQGNIRTASVTAVGNVQLGVLDSQRLAQEYASLSPEFRRFLVSLDSRLKTVTARAADYRMNQMDEEEFVKERTVRIKQGQTEENLYRITAGSASIVRKTEHGIVPLSMLKADGYFGNIPFLHLNQEPEAASVLISDDFEAEEVNLDLFADEYERLSTTFKNIVDNVVACISITSDVTSKLKAEKK
jgi:CRP-like cAMP-binding protein